MLGLGKEQVGVAIGVAPCPLVAQRGVVDRHRGRCRSAHDRSQSARAEGKAAGSMDARCVALVDVECEAVVGQCVRGYATGAQVMLQQAHFVKVCNSFDRLIEREAVMRRKLDSPRGGQRLDADIR